MPAQRAFRQRRAPVRTEVPGGIEFAIHIVNSDIFAIGKLESGALTWPKVIDCADYNFSFGGDRRLCVVWFSIE
jgi:hypothetical protein